MLLAGSELDYILAGLGLWQRKLLDAVDASSVGSYRSGCQSTQVPGVELDSSGTLAGPIDNSVPGNTMRDGFAVRQSSAAGTLDE